ncbi:MAG: archaellin/type IV pilin N-terminal domain-containing protein [Thermoplasmatota archaeon]
MKANQKFVNASNDQAEVGIGTLIVFIAMVLVAAVAAAVVINASSSLQARASSTGEQATQQVTSNILVDSLYGQRNLTSTNIAFLNMYVTLAAGAQTVDITQLNVHYTDGSKVVDWSEGTNPKFTYTFIRDASSGSVDTTNKVIGPGDLIELNMSLPVALAPNSPASVTLVPEVGGPVLDQFTTPDTYGSLKTISLTA